MTQTTIKFNPYEDSFTRKFVEKKTNGLIGKYGYQEVDRDDRCRIRFQCWRHAAPPDLCD
ncbi:hypothetical protein SV7mr_50290 [Stieleria bergensis]|uniref:Uncharacterized protein n=1 Tax=Stieleria bergensis TaxID=2528025 RepID=A0A517T2C0_9BACT|nr:hypothetical protein SV7mr_50290 [Planctomycetes bacterium SV_7m_r]